MADLKRMDKHHLEYLHYLAGLLKEYDCTVVDFGRESFKSDRLTQLELSEDFSEAALRLRCTYDLLVRHRPTGFICEIDGKTTTFRHDTGNVAVEVWYPLFARGSERPRLIVFQDAEDTGLWADRLDAKTWLRTYYMPQRFGVLQQLKFSRMIQALSGLGPDVKENPIQWNRKNASGDPFYVWPIARIKKEGNPVGETILARASKKGGSDQPPIQPSLF